MANDREYDAEVHRLQSLRCNELASRAIAAERERDGAKQVAVLAVAAQYAATQERDSALSKLDELESTVAVWRQECEKKAFAGWTHAGQVQGERDTALAKLAETTKERDDWQAAALAEREEYARDFATLHALSQSNADELARQIDLRERGVPPPRFVDPRQQAIAEALPEYDLRQRLASAERVVEDYRLLPPDVRAFAMSAMQAAERLIRCSALRAHESSGNKPEPRAVWTADSRAVALAPLTRNAQAPATRADLAALREEIAEACERTYRNWKGPPVAGVLGLRLADELRKVKP